MQQPALYQEAQHQPNSWCDTIARAAHALQKAGNPDLAVQLFQEVMTAAGLCYALLQYPESAIMLTQPKERSFSAYMQFYLL